MERRGALYIFLSRVNAEFGRLDRMLASSLGVETSANAVAHQTGFANQQDGLGILCKLLEHIRRADAVIHYVGRQLGSRIDEDDITMFMRLEPQIEQWLREQDFGFRTWTYTQWEAYMAVYVRAKERDATAPLSLFCYRLDQPGCEPDAAVVAHCDSLAQFQKGLRRLELPPWVRDADAALTAFLAQTFRQTTLHWPTPRVDRLVPDEHRKLGALIRELVDNGVLSCGEIAVLAFPLCRNVLDLPISPLDVRNFVANLVDHVNDCCVKDDLAAVWVHIHAIETLVATRDVLAAAKLRQFLDAVLERSGGDKAAVLNAYERLYPACFPDYPLNLCVEVYVHKLADRAFSVSVSYRVGNHRQFVAGSAQGASGMGCVDDPCKAIGLAISHTAETVGRLGGPERIELMLDGAMLDTDEAWRWLATARWHETGVDPSEGEPDPVVLRWPHTEKSAALVKRIAANSKICLRDVSPCVGARVVRGDPCVSKLEEWKIAIKTSTLTLWERGPLPLPQDTEPFHWSDAPRQVQRQWQHVGVALNPPDAPVYVRAGQAAARMSSRIQQFLR